MGNVFRCYVEKKPGFAVEAEHLFGELRHTLGLTGLTGVRVLRRYDVEGVDAAVYAAARTTVLSEPQVDALWDEVKRVENPHNYYVDLSQKLWDIKQSLLTSHEMA